MVRKNNTLLLCLLMAVLLLASCKSSKETATQSAKVHIEQIKKTTAVSGALSGVSAKMRLSANINGRQLSSSGNLKALKGGGVQLAITPLGIFEAARVEFLPLYVQYINKIEAEYARVDYSSIALLKQHGIGFALLESLFLNCIYVPAGLSMDSFLAAATIVDAGENMVVTYKAADITYEYHINKVTGLLAKSVGTYKNGTSVTCAYGKFQQVGDAQFPAAMELTLGGAGLGATLSFSLSRIKESNEFAPTLPSASYKKVSPESLLKLLGGK